jgi:uncharacterized protein (TIGR02118 family)
VIKVIAPALRHPTNRTLPDFHDYWAETHGPLFRNTKNVRRYVQHLTLPEAYGGEPAPTFDGVSMFWYDDLASQNRPAPVEDPEFFDLLEAVMGVPVDRTRFRAPEPGDDLTVPRLLLAVLKDDAQLFDRSTTWPTHQRSAYVVAEERVIVEGETSPDMVKAIFIASKKPGLTLGRFFDHWQSDHGRLAAKVPGLRRYVQNHAVPSVYADLGHTHDGWSEVWFDDLPSLRAAVASPEWEALREDGSNLFSYPLGVGVARERIQKDLDWTYDDWGANAMSEDDVRARLAEQGYASLAADPDAPRKIKTAAANEALAVWTHEHLVTIDESRIDVRPERRGRAARPV